jgi:Spy/CpxP family protein refolding chaperone
MLTKRTVLAYSLFALGSLLAAQDTHTPPSPADMVAHRVAHLTQLLTLTSAQQTQATTIFTNEESATSGLRTSIEAARTALETAVEANDSATISAQATQIGALTGQEVQARATAEAAFYAILTADQQTRYKAVRSAGPGGGRMHGGGFGGPPPFDE